MEKKDKRYHANFPPVEDNYIIPYGKYKGNKIVNVPAEYLIWLWDNYKCSFPVGYYIQENWEVLQEETKREKDDNS